MLSTQRRVCTFILLNRFLLFVLHFRWALYPPGRVPPSVVVHADEEDGEVDIDSPSSLQVSIGQVAIIYKLPRGLLDLSIDFV